MKEQSMSLTNAVMMIEGSKSIRQQRDRAIFLVFTLLIPDEGFDQEEAIRLIAEKLEMKPEIVAKIIEGTAATATLRERE